MFGRYKLENTGVDGQLRDAIAGELIEQLDSGALDVAIFGLPDPIDERFHCVPLFVERYVVGFASGHPFEKMKSVRLADMDGQQYLARLNCEFWNFFVRKYEELGVKLDVTYRSQREDWIQTMIRAGWDVSALPEFGVTADILTRPFIEPEIKRTVYLVTVRGRPHSPAVGAFVRDAMRWRDRKKGHELMGTE